MKEFKFMLFECSQNRSVLADHISLTCLQTFEAN